MVLIKWDWTTGGPPPADDSRCRLGHGSGHVAKGAELVLMNRMETLILNSPPRAWLQRFYEVPLLERLGGRLDGARVLEIGCGRGVGTQLLIERLGAAHVTALDLDPAMIARARPRLARFGPRVDLRQGDAAALPLGDASVDAVVDFAIIHHIPAWRDAVAEAVRVLRPGGRFFFEEVTRHALDRWSYRTFLDHPRTDRFAPRQFERELTGQGLDLRQPPVIRFFGDFVLGVAFKSSIAGDL